MEDDKREFGMGLISTIDFSKYVLPQIPDFSKFAQIPKFPKFEIPQISDFSKIQFAASQIAQTAQILNTTMLTSPTLGISEVAQKLNEISNSIQIQYTPQLLATQSIVESLQKSIAPTLKASKILAESVASFNLPNNQIFKSVEVLNRFNNFNWYERTYKEFGGTISPTELNEENVIELLLENKELIEGISHTISNSDKELTAENLDNFIFSYFNANIGKLSSTKYSIIVLVLNILITSYGLYSNFTTDKAIDTIIIPKLEENSDQTEKLKGLIKSIEKSQAINVEISLNEQSRIEDKIDNLEKINLKRKELELESNQKLENIIKELKKVNQRK